jgi:AcrR family transcriptional regulator
MARERKKTEIRKEEIAEAVLRVIQAHGLRGLNIERIAACIGIVPSAVYRHFSGKEEILDTAIATLKAKMTALVDGILSDMGDASGLDQMQALVRRHLVMVQYFQAFPRILFSDDVMSGNPARKAKVHEVIRAYLERIEKMAEQGKQDGSIRTDISPNTVAMLLWGLFQPSAMMWLISDGGFDVDKYLDRAWPAFCRAVGAPPDNA